MKGLIRTFALSGALTLDRSRPRPSFSRRKAEAQALAAIVVFAFLVTDVFAGTPEISTDKDAYTPDETIGVYFRDSPGNSNDWITLVPQATPDGKYGEWKWINSTEGTVTFRGVNEGVYEVRIHLDGTHSEPAARHVLTVSDGRIEATEPVTAFPGSGSQPEGKTAGQPGAALEGSDAYAALLDLYIREHPDAARDPEFLPYFAGLGCKAEGWHNKPRLSPFEVAEIESAAQPRLDRKLAEAGAGPAAEPVLITFRAAITVDDYDMAEGVFPIRAAPRKRSITATIRSDDFCQTVAKAKGLRHRSSVFPVWFRIGVADEESLEPSLVDIRPSHIVEMLGGKVAVKSERARAFYERGFPTIVVEVNGWVRSVARTERNFAFVTLEPVRATLRTKGNARYSQELAVLGPGQLGAFPDETDFDRDAYYLIGLADHPPPDSPALVYYNASDLDGSEVKALTGAITGAIGVDPNSIVLRPHEIGQIGAVAQTATRGGGTYVLVVGDGWRNRLNHVIEAHYPNTDLSVIQIGPEAGPEAGAPRDETSALP